MKSLSIFTVLACLIALLMFPALQSCKKYSEGPALSLRSKTERVSNTWKVDTFLKNGINLTDEFKAENRNYLETFTKDKGWSYLYISSHDDKQKTASGNWQFIDHSKQILITSNNDSKVITIIRLKEKEFWFFYMDGTDRMEWHMMQ